MISDISCQSIPTSKECDPSSHFMIKTDHGGARS